MSFKELIEKFKEIIMLTRKTVKAKTARKTTTKKKSGAKIIVGTKEANSIRVTPQATGQPPSSIRMLNSFANQYGSFQKGHIYRVPHDVRVPTARNWIRDGAAEKVE